MKTFFLILLLITINFKSFSQNKKSLNKVYWNGYAQLRATSNFDDSYSIMIKRLKFWIESTPDFAKHWSYKLQATYSSMMKEKMLLQDIKIRYQLSLFSFDLGQFVPQYSLQRFQHDYNIPSIDRALVINNLIPNGTMGVRDIGIQVNLHTQNNLIESHFGVFNGYGIKEYRFNNHGYLLTHKTALNIPLFDNQLKIGYSLMYRYAQDLPIKKVLQDSILYTGTDIRYNVFGMFKSKYIELQAEYLNANFEKGLNANGYYFLSTINIKKSQVIFMLEDYKNTYIIEHYPFFHIGYNYLINKNQIKIFLDNYFQVINGNISSYCASVQLQMFF